MSEHFNALTPAEAERLAILSEELGEAQQAIGKILRHGFESYNPTVTYSVTNREALERELGDVEAAITMLSRNGDVDGKIIETRSRLKADAVKRWTHYQIDSPPTGNKE